MNNFIRNEKSFSSRLLPLHFSFVSSEIFFGWFTCVSRLAGGVFREKVRCCCDTTLIFLLSNCQDVYSGNFSRDWMMMFPDPCSAAFFWQQITFMFKLSSSKRNDVFCLELSTPNYSNDKIIRSFLLVLCRVQNLRPLKKVGNVFIGSWLRQKKKYISKR